MYWFDCVSQKLVPGADVAAVTMPVLDRPSERSIQICQAARQDFVESQSQRGLQMM